jgi:hypothetical protein
LALALAAVIVGFGIAAIQLLPAFEQMPLSTRATAVQGGFAGATSFATPWVDVPEFFFKQFVGWGYPGTPGSTYWGPAPLKFHSEYLGLPVIALAILGAGRRTSVDRRLRQWLAGIGLLFLLIALGDGTPFYHLWWALMPYVKQMRAPGMAFFVTAFIVSCFAGFGVERIERSAGAGSEERMPSYVRAWLVAGGAFILFAAAGVFAALARALADERRNAVVGHAVTLGALTSALALVLLAVIAWLRVRRRLPPLPFVLLLVVVVGGDLWLNARPYWTYTITDRTLFQNDQITERIKATPGPTRVVDIGNVYPGNVLMALDVSQLLGQHGLELRYFDDVMGGHGVWRNLGNVHLWDLFAVRWVIAPSNASGLDSIPGYIRVARDVPTSAGNPAQLYERTAPVPYARVIPAALSLDSATIIRTVADPRMTYDRVVLLDQRDGVSTPPLAQLPAASKTHAAITHWEPGRMGIVLDPAPTAPVYVVVAENWYPDWRATVDGALVRVLRGDWTLITVPVPANARQIELTFVSSTFRRGEILSIASLVIVLATVIGPPLWRRWRGGRLQHA